MTLQKFGLLLLISYVSSMSPVFSQERVDGTVAVKFLGGGGWNDTRGGGTPCFNFRRGCHRLRLEDTDIWVKTSVAEKRYWGTYTITNRRHWKPDAHCYVDFTVVNGAIERFNLRSDGTGWVEILLDPRIAGMAAGKYALIASIATEVARRIITKGDAQDVMGQSAWMVMESFRVMSQ
ncbi:MAG: hypothetical protein AB1390_09330 [Nitrospirota bacterium]